MEHGEAPGVASLKEGQPLFLACSAHGVIGRNCGAPHRGRPSFVTRTHTLAQFGYFLIRILLDLDRRRSDFRMLLRPIFEITICDLKREFFLICSEILGS